MAFGSEQWMYSAGGFYPDEIGQSLRFNDDDGAYLGRTPSVAGNRKTWTWSAWVKRSSLVSCQLFGAYTDNNNQLIIRMPTDGGLRVFQDVGGSKVFDLTTNAVYRDVASWYHITVAFDTTESTSSDRLKLYVNGEQVTSFSTANYPALNASSEVNTLTKHRIGQRGNDTGFLDGYLAEVNFIDGQALDPTSFGEFKSGVWIPKEYTGTYGTNGFHLSFDDGNFLGKDNSTVLGSDLVTNGSFDTDISNWSLNGFCTTSWVSSGKMQITRTGGGGFTTYQAITCEIGATYAIRTQMNSVGSRGDLRVNETVDGSLSSLLILSGSNGATVELSGQFTATQTTHYVQFYIDLGATSIIVDEVSVKKISSQGNDWTPTNIASTDQMLDSPTNNFATLNPLFLPPYSSAVAMSEGNLKVTNTGANAWKNSASSMSIPRQGKWYAEFLSGAVNNNSFGLTNSSVHQDYPGNIGVTDSGVGYYSGDGKKYLPAGSSAYGDTYTAGDVISVAYDADTNQAAFYKNNVNQGAISVDDAEYCFGASVFSGTDNTTANFGQDSSFAGQKTRQGNTDANDIGDFYYAPPAGYLALCSANLPDPAIDPNRDDIPADYFNTVIYTGNGSTQSINGVGFQPDWVWTKGRSDSRIHSLLDVVRGANKYLSTNDTSAEATPANNNRITSIDADGFSLGNSTNVNASSETYVAWNWKAGDTTVANTDGTIASQASANTKAGFSVVTYTGQTTADTVGHGLEQPLDFIIVKNRDTTNQWAVYSRALGSDVFTYLNNTQAAVSGNTSVWNNTDPTSSVFSIGTSNSTSGVSSGDELVAYCFHSVEGFSKFGSYTGNGSTDGPFVYTGFRPAFVMIKAADSAYNWIIWDTTRDTYNEFTKFLYPNLSDAEAIGSNVADAVSNGFKLRATSVNRNASGETYIYMAFAEMPFKYANAR